METEALQNPSKLCTSLQISETLVTGGSLIAPRALQTLRCETVIQ
jgi:hypothetical protein